MRLSLGQQNTRIGKGSTMTKLLVVSVLALSFTTGFTCSKNAPQQAAPEAAPAQTEMAAPAEATPASGDMAPAEATPAPAETK